jgi:ethanolamine permease
MFESAFCLGELNHYFQAFMTGVSLQKTLTPFLLWGLGVGYVISGMYFGWNLGLPLGGTLGMGIATAVILVMYVTFTFSYAELACAIPKAGGVFDYAGKALGPSWGFVAGMAQVVEFILAPPAIAFAIGAYFNAFFPQVPVLSTAIVGYIFFTALNIYGIRAAAILELVVTILAVGELLLFSGLTLPHFRLEHLTHNAFPHGWGGAFAAVPFAIWFFLGIEGVANVAEETLRPQRDISRGFGWAMGTLAVLCLLIFISATGVGGWEAISSTDSPLPKALALVTGPHRLMYHLLITVGLFGLIASFHGLILAGGRCTYEMGRVRNLPSFLGALSPRFRTPAYALLGNMVIGIVALLLGKTDQIVVLSVFGAVTLYILAMVSLLRLRSLEPGMKRPFRVPLYPWFPLLALGIAVVALVALFYYNLILGLVYVGVLLLSYLFYKLLT